MYTLRIDVLNAAQLDGATPLDLTTAIRGSVDPNVKKVGMEIVTVPLTALFGLLDPGEVFGAKQIPLRLTSLTVVPGDGSADLGVGDEVRLVAPGGTEERLIDLTRDDGVQTIIDTVIPIGYRLAFDTTPGSSSGPYRVQLGFLPIQTPSNRFGTQGD